MGIDPFESASSGKSTFTSAKFFGAKIIDDMLKDAPDLQTRFVRSEMRRFGKRVRAKVVRNRVKGRPGIKWRGPTGPSAKDKGSGVGLGGTKKLGKNIRSWITGDQAADITANVRISRLLRVHEDGLTITAKPGKWLTILDPKARKQGKREIIALVKKVKIPARLKFRETFNELVPDARLRVEKAMDRAADLLEKRANKRGGKGFGAAGSAFKGF